MKRLLPLLFLLAASVAFGQCDVDRRQLSAQETSPPIVPTADPVPNAAPLAVKAEQVEIDVSEVIVKRSTATLAGFAGDIDSGETIVSQTKRKEMAGIVRVDSQAKFVNVTARQSLFEIAAVQKFADGSYLIRGPPGKYLVEVDTFDPALGIERVTRTIQIGESEPASPEVGDFASITSLARELAEKLNDPPTRLAIQRNLAGELSTISTSDMTLDEAQAGVRNAIEAALKKRTGESRYVDWLNGWRRPIQAEIERIGVQTVQQYLEAVRAASAGLVVESAPTNDPARSVTPNEPAAIRSYLAPAKPQSAILSAPIQPPHYETRQRIRRVCDGGRCRDIVEYYQVLVQ